WSLVVLIPTLFLGRFFCGWICPLGSVHHFFGSLKSERKRGKRMLESNRYKRWQTTKYYLLIAGLAAALLGSGILGWLDPIALLVRSLALSLLPGTNYALSAVLHAMEHSRFAPLQATGGILHFALGGWLLTFKQLYFRQAIGLGLIFIFLVALNFRITRFWCRALCPLGALLGIVSRWSVLGLVKHTEHCKDCDRCLLHCQGGDDPIGGVPWRQAEGPLCPNCVSDLPRQGPEIKFFPGAKNPGREFAAPQGARRFGGGSGGGSSAAQHARVRSAAQCTPAAPSGSARRGLLPGTLYPLWRVHEGLPDQRASSCPGRGGAGRSVDASYGAADWLLRNQLRALFGGLSHRSHLEDHLQREGLGRGRRTGRKANSCGHGLLRSRPLSSLGHGNRVHCLRGMVPDIAQSHLPAASRSCARRRHSQAGEATAAGSRSLCRLRRVRIRLPGPGPAGDLRDQQRREPLTDEPDPAESRQAKMTAARSTPRTIFVSTMCVVALLGAAACNRRPSLAAAFPASNDVAGWTKTSDVRTFEAADLWKYIDGEAEKYLKAGVQRASTADYKFQNKLEAVVDIYTMSSANGSAQIFDAEPAADAKSVQLADGARLFSQSLVFLKGRYLVRIVSYE